MESETSVAGLAPVFVNDERVRLGGDPSPVVGKIVAAFGKAEANAMVMRLSEKGATQGETLAVDTVIERAAGGQPVYLRVQPGQAETESAPAAAEEPAAAAPAHEAENAEATRKPAEEHSHEESSAEKPQA